MEIETRKRGKTKLFYLAHSFRENGKVRKARVYLGSDLSQEKIKAMRPDAEAMLGRRIEAYRKIEDPLRNILSSEEQATIKALVSKADLVIEHLSESEWTTFTEHFTYDTNAIEGSTVTLSETKEMIEKNRWPDREKWEISETYGVSEAIKHIRKTDVHMSIELAKKLHEIVFMNSKPFAGKLRPPGVEVVVSDSGGNILHRGAPQGRVAGLLKELVDWYAINKGKYHPIVLATVVHNQFETIHPFQDGNGRVGRLLMNNVLLKHGLPPINIELDDRHEYYSFLRAYQGAGNLRPMIELILKSYRKTRKYK